MLGPVFSDFQTPRSEELPRLDLLSLRSEDQRPGKLTCSGYRKRTSLLILGLVCYVAIAEIERWPMFKDLDFPLLLPSASQAEVFPFFNWGLFSHPRRYSWRFTIEPLKVAKDSPFASRVGHLIKVEEASFLREIRFQKLGTRFMKAFKDEDEAEIQSIGLMLENFVGPYGVEEFRLVQVKFDPLVREHEEIISVHVLGEFGTQ